MPVGALSCPVVGVDFFLDRIGVMGFARKDGARIELRRAACDLPRARARYADETDERPAPLACIAACVGWRAKRVEAQILRQIRE